MGKTIFIIKKFLSLWLFMLLAIVFIFIMIMASPFYFIYVENVELEFFKVCIGYAITLPIGAAGLLILINITNWDKLSNFKYKN